MPKDSVPYTYLASIPMRQLAYRLDKFGIFVASVSCGLIFLFVFLGVVFRAIGHPLYFTGEYSEFLMAWLIFFALGEVTREREHLAVDLITMYLPPNVLAILSVFANSLLMAIYVGLALWISAELTWNSYSDNLRSQGLMVTPLAIPQLGMVIGLSICCCRAILDFCIGFMDVLRRMRESRPRTDL